MFSPKSLAVMFGAGAVDDIAAYVSTGADNGKALIMKTELFIATGTTMPTTSSGGSGWSSQFQGPDGKMYKKVNPIFFDETGKKLSSTSSLIANNKYFCTYDLEVTGSVIEISATSFPGTLTLGHHCGIKQINLVNCWKTKFMVA